MASSNIPRPEYPRPDFERTDWLNLNGTWEFRFDPGGAGLIEGWQQPGAAGYDKAITVPFPWESRLSGIEAKDYKGAAWHRRTVTIPQEWKDRRVFICFGAVDWEAEVWLDGERLGAHEGGYTPFEFEITAHAAPGSSHVIVVRALDETSHEQPAGKQVNWYTTTSGIWQTVWLEARGNTYVKSLKVSTDAMNGVVAFAIETDSAGSFDGELVIHFEDASLPDEVCMIEIPPGTAAHVCSIRMEAPRLWEPEDPWLYRFSVELADENKAIVDSVRSYFGMRTLAVGVWGSNPHPCILLNGRPLYLRATLNQAFTPEGIYAYPGDDAIREDVEANLKAGFNGMRVHIKVDDPRLYYWCDVLGCVVVYDFPGFWKWSADAQRRWEAVFREALDRDRNHPSIIVWVLFNETWGLFDPAYDAERQEWVAEMYRRAKELDPSRLVEDNSPCRYDHVVTDLNTWHFYIADMAEARRHIEDAVNQVYPGSKWNYTGGNVQGSEPFLNSEYGSVGCGDGDQDVSFGLKALTGLLRAHAKIGGYVYTELMDIEWEHNGILNYDRAPKDFGYGGLFPGMTLADVNNADYIILGELPVARAKPGQRISVPVSLSHYSHRTEEEVTLVWGLAYEGELESVALSEPVRRKVRWNRYDVIDAGAIEAVLPGMNCAAALCVWLEDEEGEILSRNFLELDVHGEAPPRVDSLKGSRCVLRAEPAEYGAAEWKGEVSAEDGVFRAGGTGRVSYDLRLPVELNSVEVQEIEAAFEASTYAPGKRLDWPGRSNAADYPQTDERKIPGRLQVSVGSVSTIVTLSDCPSDIRAILSNSNARKWRGYGERFRVKVLLGDRERSELARTGVLRLTFEVPEGEDANGLALYSSRMGRYPLGIRVEVKGK